MICMACALKAGASIAVLLSNIFCPTSSLNITNQGKFHDITQKTIPPFYLEVFSLQTQTHFNIVSD